MSERARWVVTGAASGIGRALADVASRSGAEVIGWDREPGPPGHPWTVVDLADDDAIAAAAGALDGPVDCFAHCAGINPPSRIADGTALAGLRRCMAVNTDSFVLAVSLLADRLAQGGGAVVTVTSVADTLTSSLTLGYGASKAALRRIVAHLATELGPRGIRVNAVAPGPVRTPMTEAVWDDPEIGPRRTASIPLGRPGEAEEVARVLYFLGSPASSYVSGAVVPVDGGLLAGAGTVALG